VKRRRSRRKTLFELAGFGRKDYEVTTVVLAVIVAVSSDAGTKLKCDHALKGLRKLNRLIHR
jgi:hypothetical protein